jgi:hypothetical protein
VSAEEGKNVDGRGTSPAMTGIESKAKGPRETIARPFVV